MKNLKYFLILLFGTGNLLNANTISVSSISELKSAIANAAPGDSIIMKCGAYSNTSAINISRSGTAEKPILISAEEVGLVEIKGSSGFVLSSPAKYTVLKGFKFTHSTGTMKINVGATHNLILRNIFECAPAGTGNKPYLSISGDDNEIAYNTFQNKDTEGCMITIQGPGGSEMAQRTWIHHNYFYNFMNSGANNSSAIQIGLSGRSLSSAYSVVEYNLFIKTAGENEGCVCNKSCHNVYRYNTFGEGSTELSLRHGNFCEVYNNYFINCQGLRFCGDDHKIYNNYFSGCSYAINCVNGDGIVPPDGTDKLTSHDRPDRIEISFNTLVNNNDNFGMPSRSNGYGAIDITFANNVILGGSPISISSPYVTPVWEGNIIWATKNNNAGNIPQSGYQWVDPLLERDALGLYRLSASSPAINASAGSYAQVTNDIDCQAREGIADTGADEYSTGPVLFEPLTSAEVGAFEGTGMAAPDSPTNLGATPVSGRQIDLAWTDNSDNETQFRIDWSLDGGIT